MNDTQKKQQEDYFKMVLKHSNENGTFIWWAKGASYSILGGKFNPINSKSRKSMMSTTGKTFHDECMVK